MPYINEAEPTAERRYILAIPPVSLHLSISIALQEALKRKTAQLHAERRATTDTPSRVGPLSQEYQSCERVIPVSIS